MTENLQIQSLAGSWKALTEDGRTYDVTLPATLDENDVGAPDAPAVATRLTRLHTYEGRAVYARSAVLERAEDSRLFLKVERSRTLSLCVDGRPVPKRTGSLSTPWTFELTPFADGAAHRLELTCDNHYVNQPRNAIVYSSAATDETQTNWNGLLGQLGLIEQPRVFADQIRLLMDESGARVCVTIDADELWQGEIRVRSDAFAGDATLQADVTAGRTDLWLDVAINPDAARWDELEGNLYELTAELIGVGTWRTTCGVRSFGSNADGRLTINGRVFFLRGEANCCVFPETGHAPLTEEEWTRVLQTYAAYGVNCMRFHSHCPPPAAFAAADRMGMLMQPELSHWDPKYALETEEAYACYRDEITEIVRVYGCHPSFVMLTLGNELHTDERGVERMHSLLALARAIDPTRLYAWGSNNFYGVRGADDESDFYTSMSYHDEVMRATSPNMEGFLNHESPTTTHTYDKGFDELRSAYAKPMFEFEVGQYEILPDFDEIDDFRGVTRAVNYEMIRAHAAEKGLLKEWKTYVEATGELSLLCYREEVEAALRTERMSGLSLLGLQDFPGQGTAIVGMLNAHLQAKPFAFAKPERFHAFFRDVLPLAMLSARCFASRDTLAVGLALANYGKRAVKGGIRWTLSGAGQCLEGTTEVLNCEIGRVTHANDVNVPLKAWTQPTKLLLTLEIDGHRNEYPLWVYPDAPVACPENVAIVGDWHEAERRLRNGERVLLSPAATAEAFPRSIRSQFSPDFWSVGNFPEQEGGMGCLIDTKHPIFERFPTERQTNWPWWTMAGGRAFELPRSIRPIVTVMDSYKFLRHLALLAECRVGAGRLMISGMGLAENDDLVEVRALTNAALRYMASDAFEPQSELSFEQLSEMFTAREKE